MIGASSTATVTSGVCSAFGRGRERENEEACIISVHTRFPALSSLSVCLESMVILLCSHAKTLDHDRVI